MEKSILEKNSFQTMMMVGFGSNPEKLQAIVPELDELGISFDKFVRYIEKYFLSDFSGWEHIDLRLALNNYIMKKLEKICTKKVSYFQPIPIYLTYNSNRKITEFQNIEQGIKFFEDNKNFENKFIKRLKKWLLK